ncbi:MAG TPA: ABC transporter substrate-binding protein [Candidatus Binatia bacterium]|nr:ABC transporter substrate-binding protein [Candidatus Binatia bacterium]
MQRSRAQFLKLALSSLALGLPSAAGAQGTLRVGATANDSYAEPYYAQDQGFFQQAGLGVDLQTFSNGAGVTTALAAGAIDIGITNPISLANAVEHGIPFRFFATGALYNREELALCVAPDSPIKTAKDLEGKAVATTAIKDSNSLHTIAWIDQNGGDASKVQLVEIPFSAMAAAVKRGTVAAAPIAEPALSVAKKEGSVRVLGHPMDVYGKRFMVGGWFSRLDWINANLPLVRRYVATIYATARWANTHPDESATILAKYAKMDPATVRTMNRAPYGDSFSPALFQPYLDLGYKYKYLEHQLKATDLSTKI